MSSSWLPSVDERTSSMGRRARWHFRVNTFTLLMAFLASIPIAICNHDSSTGISVWDHSRDVCSTGALDCSGYAGATCYSTGPNHGSCYNPTTAVEYATEEGPKKRIKFAGSYNSNMGGISGADSLCTTELGVPSKALLGDDSTLCGGGPCRRAPPLGEIDWPFQANTQYFSWDFQHLIGTTDSNKLLVGPYSYPIYPSGSINQLSGFNTDWSARAGCTCTGWTVSNGADCMAVGWLCANTADSCCMGPGCMLNGGAGTCGSGRIICVET